MIKFIWVLGLLAASFPGFAYNLPPEDQTSIWPSIPFVRGADLCKFENAYSQTRSEYMREMVGNASYLMRSGAYGSEALQMLAAFNSLYERNQALAARGKHLDLTLESTLKAYLDGYYRNIRPRTQKLTFSNFDHVLGQLDAVISGQRPTGYPEDVLERLDYIAYGTYALAPDCRGTVQVTLHLIGKNGATKSYVGEGQPSVVMSRIATQLFEEFQRTKFPSQVRVGNQTLTLIGALNGSVAVANTPRNAELACQTLGARLPNQFELELLDGYGDWSGGVSLGTQVWAMPGGMVYHPQLQNPSPVRNRWEVNAQKFYYYCVR